tara:strand:- start:236 stop:973 length:738 start_codon:yes stop_codon:yes gene_type:complete
MSSEFNIYGIFTPNFTINSVVGIIEKRLAGYTKVNDKLGFLNAVLILHNEKNCLSEDELMFEREKYKNYPFMLERMDAYYPIKDWISEELNKVESENKKAKKAEDSKKQIIDAQRSFKIDKDYAHLLLNMWEFMKDRKNDLIHPDTAFEDFKIIFEHKKKAEIKNRIAWVGYKMTLLKLFYTLSRKEIIQNVDLTGDIINPLNLTFIDINTKKPFDLWRNTHTTMLSNTVKRGQYKIDKILELFQ